MIRSMYSAVTGLKGHQTMLDVIGNNIANVNTVGFKSSRVLFQDLYYQTLSNASAPTATSGGTNAMQIGYGSKIGSIDLITTRSGYQETSRTLDLYVAGEGYFAVKNVKDEILYTRIGSFDFNTEGYLIDKNGNFVLDDAQNKIQIADFDNYTGIFIDRDGQILGTDTTTKAITSIGQVGLASFANPNGLVQNGDMYYLESLSSGAAVFEKPGTVATGELVPGGLEMSNVDLTKEFTDMIVAQRGFQANSRVITTSDQVLEELVNLKR
jgi:flagellar hook protein FlgE